MKEAAIFHRLRILGAVCGFVGAAFLRAQAGEPTAFQLIREGNRFIGEQSQDKPLAVYSDKSLTGLTPGIWYVDYYDPDATYKIIEVKFGAGLKLDVHRPWKLFGGSSSEDKKLDLKTLKVDSDAALGIAIIVVLGTADSFHGKSERGGKTGPARAVHVLHPL